MLIYLIFYVLDHVYLPDILCPWSCWSTWYSMSLIMLTTLLSASLSKLCPSSGMIFQPFLEPSALLMLKDTSCDGSHRDNFDESLETLSAVSRGFLSRRYRFFKSVGPSLWISLGEWGGGGRVFVYLFHFHPYYTKQLLIFKIINYFKQNIDETHSKQ